MQRGEQETTKAGGGWGAELRNKEMARQRHLAVAIRRNMPTVNSGQGLRSNISDLHRHSMELLKE